MKFARALLAVMCLAALSAIGPSAIAAQSGGQGGAAQLEGAAYITGAWRVAGAMTATARPRSISS